MINWRKSQSHLIDFERLFFYLFEEKRVFAQPPLASSPNKRVFAQPPLATEREERRERKALQIKNITNMVLIYIYENYSLSLSLLDSFVHWQS
jgi:hypothetical protein